MENRPKIVLYEVYFGVLYHVYFICTVMPRYNAPRYNANRICLQIIACNGYCRLCIKTFNLKRSLDCEFRHHKLA